MSIYLLVEIFLHGLLMWLDKIVIEILNELIMKKIDFFYMDNTQRSNPLLPIFTNAKHVCLLVFSPSESESQSQKKTLTKSLLATHF